MVSQRKVWIDATWKYLRGKAGRRCPRGNNRATVDADGDCLLLSWWTGSPQSEGWWMPTRLLEGTKNRSQLGRNRNLLLLFQVDLSWYEIEVDSESEFVVGKQSISTKPMMGVLRESLVRLLIWENKMKEAVVIRLMHFQVNGSIINVTQMSFCTISKTVS